MEKKIEKNKAFLVDRIDPEFGLLEKLLTSKILTKEEVHRIKLKDNTTEDKNRILLDFILKNKKANEFISALMDSGQNHLANYLNADGDYRFSFGDDWPLNESEINRLEMNRESLIDILDTTELCFRLFTKMVINNWQKQFIFSKPTDSEKNEALLDILTKISVRQYKQTIACLNESNQRHVADLLSEGGVVVRVHANLEGAVGNVDEVENEIISQLTKVLENRPIDEATRLLELTYQRIIAAKKGHSIVIYIHCMTQDELVQLIDLLKADGLKDIVERVFTVLLSIEDSPRVTLVSSVDEFTKAATYFDDKHTSNKKKLMASATENEQLIEIKQERQRASSTNIEIKLQILSVCPQFVIDVDPDRLSDYLVQENVITIDDWQRISVENRTRPDKCRALLNRLFYTQHPRAFISVLKALNKENHYLREYIGCKESACGISVQPEEQAVTSDKVKTEELEKELYRERRRCADLIEDRRRIQEELEIQKRKYDELNYKLERLQIELAAAGLGDVHLTKKFHDIKTGDKICYKDNPILVKTIRTKAAEVNRKGISGLAIADNELFMTSFQTNDIEVYDLTNLTLTRNWKLDPLINPYDLGYCNINKCLYIMDATYIDVTKKLFRVDRNGRLLKFWTTRKVYGCISVTFDCNVVMAEYEGHTIIEYTADGEIAREMKLSTNKAILVHPRYAIKLTHNRFLISHGEGDDSLHRVCLVDVIGDTIMSIVGSTCTGRLNTPIYLAIDSRGSIIVIDRENSRVLALTSDMEFMREIIPRNKEGMHRPERMVIDQTNGRLLVAHNDVYWSECRVFVFQIL